MFDANGDDPELILAPTTRITDNADSGVDKERVRPARRQTVPLWGEARLHVPRAWRRPCALIIVAATFWLDLQTPVGWNVPATYIVAILFAGWRGPRDAWVVTSAVTLLTAAGAVLSPPQGGDLAAGLFNRGIDLVIIWGTLGVVLVGRRAASDIQRSVQDLSDFKYALDQSSIVATTDRRGRITYVNDNFCEISKYPREELIGQDHRLINSGHHPKAFMQDLWRTIGRGHVWHGEIKNRAKDGSYYWVDTTIVPFLDARGKPYQYLAIRNDITSRKATEDTLRTQEALARLGQMAAVVAHEVKNPLAGILGSLQIVRSRVPEGPDAQILDLMVARLKALNEMVEDLLEFTRPRPLACVVVDLPQLLHETAQLLRSDERTRAVTIEVQNGAAVVLRADAEQLQRVFLNLFMNAAQAMGDGGIVRVTTRNDDGQCEVAITDHGGGIPSEIRQQIFEPFFTTKTRGTGLGLAIVKRVVERHGGTIDVTCPPHGGTTFRVTLPWSPPT